MIRLQMLEWAWGSKAILQRQDNDGDENYYLRAIVLDSASIRDPTP